MLWGFEKVGRVLLDQYTNTFYAVSEKAKGGHNNYQPAVLATTKQERDNFTISVAHNGMGILKSWVYKNYHSVTLGLNRCGTTNFNL